MPYDKETRDALQAYDDKKYTPAQLQIYAKAKKFVAQSWLKLLPETGNKRSMRNFSKNYPPSCLKEGDAAYIADMVAQIMGDAEQFKASIDKFFSDLQEPLEAGFKACAKAYEDFNDCVCENHDKINFLKGWTHGFLGYKTHSAVTERLQAMRERFEKY